ncbi:hypothetical protein TanjilG_18736 [Lupinus angustifolius]|uniref:Uncharacterized protein n=1 Tax=Lupinus angustifolius TaxID=3871 RepID=A0A1J7GZJ8_LUPAN|nr:hypothetical protein TanjilG_18736 [Lupinus angustifolius]
MGLSSPAWVEALSSWPGLPFLKWKHEEDDVMGSVFIGGDMGIERIGIVAMRDDLRSLSARLKNHGFSEDDNVVATRTVDGEDGGFNFGSNGIVGTRQQV